MWRIMANLICIRIGRETGCFTEKFKSSDGVEYTAKVHISSGYYHDIKVTLEWKRISNLFIRFKIYSDPPSSDCYQKSVMINDGIQTSMHASLAHSSYNNSLTISVIPFRNLTKRAETLPSLNYRDQTDVKPTKGPVTLKKLEELSKDMKCVLNTGTLSDVVLSDGKTEIRAHKLILSIRSPVFAKMFQHKMKENLENKITIKDIPIEVLRKLLDFMYTGAVDIKCMQMAISLYIAAEKYDIKCLKEVCSQVLRDVDLDNILEVIILADLHSDKLLKKAALDFIVRNYSQVKALESWGVFLVENQMLAIEVLSSVADNVN